VIYKNNMHEKKLRYIEFFNKKNRSFHCFKDKDDAFRNTATNLFYFSRE